MLTVSDSNIPKASAATPDFISGLAFRFLAAIDIEEFSKRSAAEQAKAQDNLEHVTSEAAASAGLDRSRWYRQPGGDGELVIFPADADGLSLVAEYPRCLVSALGQVNRSAGQSPRLRVRLAIHHGTIYPGSCFGPVGRGPTTVKRLLDAPVLRQRLKRQTDLDIAWIVSDAVYNEIVQSRFHELDPADFLRTKARIKDASFVGYLFSATSASAVA